MVQYSKRKVFVWLPAFFWMIFIFYLSHQPATESSELSRGVTDVIIYLIEMVITPVKLDIGCFHFLIRKSAHFIAYFILGFLVMFALKGSKVNNVRAVVLTMTICILYAISDEVHQLFIPGRSGELRDVIIDSTGASVGLFVYFSMMKVKHWIIGT